MKISLAAAILACVAISSIASAREPLTDHPLISPYEGSRIRHKSVIGFDEHNAFMGMDESGKEPTGLALEGKITKVFLRETERALYPGSLSEL